MKLEDHYLKDLLARLDGQASQRSPMDESKTTESNVALAEMPGDQCAPADKPSVDALLEERLSALRQQISVLGSGPLAISPKARSSEVLVTMATSTDQRAAAEGTTFLPAAPNTLAEVGLEKEAIEAIALKFLLNRGVCAGRQIAEQLGLPFSLMERILFSMKSDQLLVQKGSAPLSDYIYQLTPQGLEDARRHYKSCSYFGTLPVPLEEYIASVKAQTIRGMQPSQQDLAAVFNDLLVSEELQHQVGQAVHSGKGFFLYGAPGNGKTSVAERVARAFGQYIWIPRTVGIAGEIVRLYDPCNHEEIPAGSEGLPTVPYDRRWVRIKRPTVIAGGELTMDRLEITVNKATGVNEAPLQLKSNCGVLVIDDFGRQRMAVSELLNRWIVPLDRRYDFLNLPSGKTVQVPFDQLLVFSTNLEPRDLVDEAFLRRISYKIEVPDPTLDDFRTLISRYASSIGIDYDEPAVEHLIREHYLATKRPVRACHARDLLDHVSSYCGYRKLPLKMTIQAFDAAVRNYFGLMG